MLAGEAALKVRSLYVGEHCDGMCNIRDILRKVDKIRHKLEDGTNSRKVQCN